MSKFDGFLFSKLWAIGSKSEGPVYFLQQFNYKEIPIITKSPPFIPEPQLQKRLASKVTIEGKLNEDGLYFESIAPYTKIRSQETRKPELIVDLKPEAEEVWVLKITPYHPRPFKVELKVQWPYRSIWWGACPTSQIYDFIVEFQGKLIWQWSRGRMFLQAVTPVKIEGGAPYTFREVWIIDPAIIKAEGLYTVRGIFIASGQDVEKKVRVKFVKKTDSGR